MSSSMKKTTPNKKRKTAVQFACFVLTRVTEKTRKLFKSVWWRQNVKTKQRGSFQTTLFMYGIYGECWTAFRTEKHSVLS
jgi:hypothetical protein